jgi:hypothetical protein
MEGKDLIRTTVASFLGAFFGLYVGINYFGAPFEGKVESEKGIVKVYQNLRVVDKNGMDKYTVLYKVGTNNIYEDSKTILQEQTENVAKSIEERTK